MSQRPGITNFPLASTTRESCGYLALLSALTDLINPPSTTIVRPEIFLPETTSITVALRITTGRAQSELPIRKIVIMAAMKHLIIDSLVISTIPYVHPLRLDRHWLKLTRVKDHQCLDRLKVSSFIRVRNLFSRIWMHCRFPLVELISQSHQ